LDRDREENGEHKIYDPLQRLEQILENVQEHIENESVQLSLFSVCLFNDLCVYLMMHVGFIGLEEDEKVVKGEKKV